MVEVERWAYEAEDADAPSESSRWTDFQAAP